MAHDRGKTRTAPKRAAADRLKKTLLPGRDVGRSTLKLSEIAPATANSRAAGAHLRS
jgi:hypothetical protein